MAEEVMPQHIEHFERLMLGRGFQAKGERRPTSPNGVLEQAGYSR
jgi:hypothetical protein